MHIGINTFLFCSPFSNEHLHYLKTFAEWGFGCAEIAVENASLVDGDQVRHAWKQSGLSHIITCGAYGPGRDLRGTQDEQEAALQYTRDVLDMMPAYASTLYCGPLYSAVGHAEAYSADEKERQQTLVANHLHDLASYAEERGIVIAMEVLNRFETDFMNTAQQGVAMVERVGHPALKIHLDTFHMNMEERSIADGIRAAGKHLAHLHCSENHRGAPGSGAINWEAVRDALHDVGYAGDVVIESFSQKVKTIARACCVWRDPGEPQTIAQDGLRYLRQVFKA